MDFRFIELDIPVAVKGIVLQPGTSIQRGPSFGPERLSSYLTVFILYCKINSPSSKGFWFNKRLKRAQGFLNY